jgi:hypothetical protein
MKDSRHYVRATVNDPVANCATSPVAILFAVVRVAQKSMLPPVAASRTAKHEAVPHGPPVAVLVGNVIVVELAVPAFVAEAIDEKFTRA